MGTENNVVSGPLVGGNAGEDGLRAAFDAAAEKVSLSDTAFKPGAMDPPSPAQAETTEQPVDETATENAAPVETEGKAETAEEKAQRLRDEKGRFAKEGETPKTEAKPDAAKPSTAMSPPAHWDAGKREAFGKLPPDGQKIVLDLAKASEAHLTRKSMELAEDKRFADGVRSLVTDDIRADMRAAGVDEVSGIKALLDLHRAYRSNPASYVRRVAVMSKLDPRSIFPELHGGQQADQGEQPPADPRFTQLQETIQALQGKVGGFERERQEAARRQQETLESAAGDVIAKFRTATDEGGGLAHPHFEEVKDEVAQLCATHPRLKNITDMGERLAQAYETAVYARPDLRSQIVETETQRKAAEARRQADVDKARRAQPAIKPTPGIASGKPKMNSLDDALSHAMRGIGGA